MINKDIYMIENERFRISVAAKGAEIVEIIDKATQRNIQWSGDKDVWDGHAPLLFPNTGRVTQDKFVVQGIEYEGIKHGFARLFDFSLVSHSKDRLQLRLISTEEALKFFPFNFEIQCTFFLEGCQLTHKVDVINNDTEQMRFGIGFHPSFAVPFDDVHTTNDYELHFCKLESPLCVDTMPTGLLSGKSFYLERNTHDIQLTDTLFDNDSLCMVNLQSDSISLVEKDSGRSITCHIKGFPYVLIWSAPTKPMKFICIEPWESLPSEERGSLEWNSKPCAACLAPGGLYSTALVLDFNV